VCLGSHRYLEPTGINKSAHIRQNERLGSYCRRRVKEDGDNEVARCKGVWHRQRCCIEILGTRADKAPNLLSCIL
jgi:hypothetical protein